MSAGRRIALQGCLLLGLAAALAGCGDGSSLSWCFNGGGSGVSAGYNSTDCPPARPEQPASAP